MGLTEEPGAGRESRVAGSLVKVNGLMRRALRGAERSSSRSFDFNSRCAPKAGARHREMSLRMTELEIDGPLRNCRRDAGATEERPAGETPALL